jgi:3-hydroxybutyryl-CoA dehydrogenase
MKRVCCFGESPLVEEYATLLLNKGFTVHARLNTSADGMPRAVRKVAKPVKAVDAGLELTNTDAARKHQNIRELDAALPAALPILTSAVTVTLAEQQQWVRHPERLIGLGALPSFLEGTLVELSTIACTSEKTFAAAAALVTAIGKESARVADTAGMVLPRIVCMIVNEAYFAMQEGVAPAREIDTAMKLGTAYPHGPVEWGERIGKRQVAAVIAAMHTSFGEDRYRIAPLLRRSAFGTTP